MSLHQVISRYLNGITSLTDEICFECNLLKAHLIIIKWNKSSTFLVITFASILHDAPLQEKIVIMVN